MVPSLGERAKTSVYWSIALKIVQQCYYLVVFIVLARILDAKDFGAMGIAMAIIMYANNFTAFGFIAAIVQRSEITREHESSVFLFNLIFSIVLIPLSFAIADPLSEYFDAPELRSLIPTLSVIFPISTFSAIPMALLRRNLEFKLYSIINLIGELALSSFTLLFALVGLGVWSLAYGKIIGLLIEVIVVLFKTKWRPSWRFSTEAFKEVLDFGFLDFLRSQMRYINNYINYFIVGRILGPALLGTFDRAISIAYMPQRRIHMQINAVIFSAYSRVQDDLTRARNSFSKTMLGLSLTSFPILIGIAIISPYFVNICLGSSWESMIIPMEILCFDALVKIIGNTIGMINLATNAYRKQTIIDFICMLIFVALCLGGAHWGLAGVCVGSLTSAIIAFGLNSMLIRKNLKVGWGGILKPLLPGGLAATVMSIVCLAFIRWLLGEYNLLNMLLIVGIGGATFMAFIMLGPLKEARNIVKEIIFDILSFTKTQFANVMN